MKLTLLMQVPTQCSPFHLDPPRCSPHSTSEPRPRRTAWVQPCTPCHTALPVSALPALQIQYSLEHKRGSRPWGKLRKGSKLRPLLLTTPTRSHILQVSFNSLFLLFFQVNFAFDHLGKSDKYKRGKTILSPSTTAQLAYFPPVISRVFSFGFPPLPFRVHHKHFLHVFNNSFIHSL